MLELVLGRSGRGKSHYMMEQMGKDRQAGYANILYLVPDQFTLEAERQLIQTLNLPGLFSIQVLSFRRLILRLQQELGGGGFPVLDTVGKAIYMSQLLYDYEQELTHYHAGYQNSALSHALSKIVTEAKQFGLAPDDFLAVSSGKFQDIGRLYQEYERQKGDYLDQEDVIALVTENVGRSALLTDARVYIDSFDVFTQQAYRLMESMAKVTSRIAVALCADETNDFLFRLPNQTAEKLLRLPIPHEITRLSMNRYHHNDIGRLEENLYAKNQKSYPVSDGSIALTEFADTYQEVEGVAAAILEKHRQGVPFRDMAVICNDLPAYGRLLEQVFHRVGIPSYLDQKISLIKSALGQYILATLQCCAAFDLTQYFHRLKEGLFPFDEDTLETFETYITARGAKKLFRPLLDNPALEAVRKAADLTPLTKALQAAKSGKAFGEALLKHLSTLSFTPETDLEQEQMDGIFTILSTLTQFLGDREIDLPLFIQLLEAGLTAVEVGTLPQRMDDVLIGDVSRSKLHDISCLFLIGVNEGLLPKTLRQTTLMTDEDRRRLKEQGKVLGRDSQDLCSLERLLTYKVMSKPKTYLYCSRPARSIYGEAQTISPLFGQIRQIFPSLPLASGRQAEKRLLYAPDLAFAALTQRLRSVSIENEPLWNGVYSYYLRHDPDRLNAALQEKAFTLSIGREAANALYGKRLLSATRLEEYFHCPFKQFVHYGLRPSPVKRFQIEPLDTGSILHNLLDAFSKQLASGSVPSQKEADDLIDRLVAEKLQGYHDGVFADNNVNRLMAARVTSMAKSAVHHLLSQVDGFSLFSSELAFGMGGVPPITLSFSDGTQLELSGRVDRIDVDDGGQVRVIDYKSGKVPLDYTSIFYGLKLQLLIYMEASLREVERQKGMTPYPEGLLYLTLQESYQKFDSPKELEQKVAAAWEKALDVSRIDLKKLSLKEKPEASGERMERLLVLGKRRARKAAEEIAAGNISIAPVRMSGFSACERCQYGAICQNDGQVHVDLKTLKQGDFFAQLEQEGKEDGVES